MIPAARRRAYPVLSLMPAPGDVDIVIGAELMEAGRAIQRGLVTPDRTTLIASSHRSLAVQREDRAGRRHRRFRPRSMTQPQAAAKRFIAFDMARARRENRQRHLGGAVRRARRLRRAAVPARGLSRRRSARPASASSRACARSRAGLDERGRCGSRRTPPAAAEACVAGKRYPALAPIGDAGFDALVAARARASRAAARHDRRRSAQGRRLSGRRLRPRISRSARRLPGARSAAASRAA